MWQITGTQAESGLQMIKLGSVMMAEKSGIRYQCLKLSVRHFKSQISASLSAAEWKSSYPWKQLWSLSI